MKFFITTLKSYARAKDGASAIEYALLAALIAAVITTAASAVGTEITNSLNDAVTALGGTPA